MLDGLSRSAQASPAAPANQGGSSLALGGGSFLKALVSAASSSMTEQREMGVNRKWVTCVEGPSAGPHLATAGAELSSSEPAASQVVSLDLAGCCFLYFSDVLIQKWSHTLNRKCGDLTSGRKIS